MILTTQNRPMSLGLGQPAPKMSTAAIAGQAIGGIFGQIGTVVTTLLGQSAERKFQKNERRMVQLQASAAQTMARIQTDFQLEMMREKEKTKRAIAPAFILPATIVGVAVVGGVLYMVLTRRRGQ